MEDVLQFNSKVKLLVADVDETIADLFVPTTPEMISELNRLLQEGKSLFLVSGSGLRSIKTRVSDLISPELRKHVLISHCSGAEIVGFDKEGNLLEKPHYSIYDQTLNKEQKDTWRKIVQQIIDEFHLEPHPVAPVKEFKELYGDNPLAVLYDDRGPQITFEFINAYQLTDQQIEQLRNHIPNFDMADLRIPIMERVGKLLEEANIPITPRLGGMFALDLAIKGSSKTTSVRFVLENEELRSSLGLNTSDINNPEIFEVWGDKFSVLTGTDRHMSEALPKQTRSVDFRIENPEEFSKGYNVVVWNGKKHLHEGLLEYLQNRS